MRPRKDAAGLEPTPFSSKEKLELFAETNLKLLHQTKQMILSRSAHVFTILIFVATSATSFLVLCYKVIHGKLHYIWHPQGESNPPIQA